MTKLRLIKRQQIKQRLIKQRLIKRQLTKQRQIKQRLIKRQLIKQRLIKPQPTQLKTFKLPSWGIHKLSVCPMRKLPAPRARFALCCPAQTLAKVTLNKP